MAHQKRFVDIPVLIRKSPPDAVGSTINDVPGAPHLPADRLRPADRRARLGIRPLGGAADKPDDSYQYTLLFARVLQLVRQDYVDPDKTSYKDLTYAALRGMLSSLDPHSQFLDEENFQDIQRETKGEFSGLGIVIGVRTARW